MFTPIAEPISWSNERPFPPPPVNELKGANWRIHWKNGQVVGSLVDKYAIWFDPNCPDLLFFHLDVREREDVPNCSGKIAH